MSVTGTVRSSDGAPIEGVLVMGADLNYSETDANGCFTLPRPELALFFWCSGYLPQARPLTGDRQIEVVLEPTLPVRTRAAGA